MCAPSTDEVESLRAELARTRSLLVQLCKLAELGRMTASVVHEINQPLAGIKSFAQIVARKMAADDPNHARVKMIEEQAAVLEVMVERLRTFARQASTEKRPVAIAAVVATATRLLEFQLRKRGVSVEWADGEPSTIVAGDENQLQQVFVNLLVNARDAIEDCEGSERRVRLFHSITRGDGVCRVVVADDGAGIDAATRARLFEPFFTTKGADRGTGLGLTISREILGEHGGGLRVLDERDVAALGDDGLRTAFELTVPLWTVSGDSRTPTESG